MSFGGEAGSLASLRTPSNVSSLRSVGTLSALSSPSVSSRGSVSTAELGRIPCLNPCPHCRSLFPRNESFNEHVRACAAASERAKKQEDKPGPTAEAKAALRSKDAKKARSASKKRGRKSPDKPSGKEPKPKILYARRKPIGRAKSQSRTKGAVGGRRRMKRSKSGRSVTEEEQKGVDQLRNLRQADNLRQRDSEYSDGVGGGGSARALSGGASPNNSSRSGADSGGGVRVRRLSQERHRRVGSGGRPGPQPIERIQEAQDTANELRRDIHLARQASKHLLREVQEMRDELQRDPRSDA